MKVLVESNADGHGFSRLPVSELMVQQSSFIPDNLHADLNYSMFLLRKVSLHVQSGGRDAQLVS